jgi:hypothetical protein
MLLVAIKKSKGGRGYMEFMNRGGQPVAAPAPAQHPVRGKRERSKVLRVISSILLISVALLVAAVAIYISTSSGKSEGEYVNKDKFQAVFLNGGQVYFGKIRTLNSQYITVDNIYYLRVNQQATQGTDAAAASDQDISLAKLGCELHGPEDEMVINREQVTFWENLKDDGQVAKAITEFVKQNPDGQKCTTAES